MRRCPRWPRDRGRAPDPRGPPVRRLMPFFGRKKANFWLKKSRRRFQSNRSYGSPYIYETVKGQQDRTQKQRETERQIQSRRGGLPTPWRPRTRGGTLLPSREEVKEEEDEGHSPSPSLPVVPERYRGHHHHRNLHQQLHRHHHQLFPPLCSGVTSLLPAVIST